MVKAGEMRSHKPVREYRMHQEEAKRVSVTCPENKRQLDFTRELKYCWTVINFVDIFEELPRMSLLLCGSSIQ